MRTPYPHGHSRAHVASQDAHVLHDQILDIFCITKEPPTTKPSFRRSRKLKIQIFKLTCGNNSFSWMPQLKIWTKYTIIHPFLSQLGWMCYRLPSLWQNIRETIHTTTSKHLWDLRIPTPKIQKLMEIFSQIAIIYLMCIIVNKRKLENK